MVPSEETIYCPACLMRGDSQDKSFNTVVENRLSNNMTMESVAGQYDISDESMVLTSSDEFDNVNNLIAEGRRNLEQQEQRNRTNMVVHVAQNVGQQEVVPTREEKAKQQADEMVKEAVNAKSRLLQPPGECRSCNIANHRLPQGQNSTIPQQGLPVLGQGQGVMVPYPINHNQPLFQPGNINMTDFERSRFYEAMLIDQNERKVGAHVDPKMQDRVGRGEFVNLQRLLPKRKLNLDPDDKSLHMENVGGVCSLTEANESLKDYPPVNCLSRWEDAFRIYMSIYIRYNPHRADKILQYLDNIKNAGRTYPWELVSNYDQRFRELVHRNPGRHWGVISYDDYYKEILSPFAAAANGEGNSRWQSSNSNPQGNSGNPSSRNKIKRKACWAYNKFGNCRYAEECRFEHKCTYCGKLGHPECKCRSKRTQTKTSGHFRRDDR